MTAGTYSLTIEQGATLRLIVTYKDPTGAPIDLTGYSARCQIRRSVGGSILLNLTTQNGGIILGGSAGTITLLASASTTTPLTGSGVYDLELVSSGGEVTRVLEGTVVISPNVTRP
jgi:hypothetical protein